jgi:membrane-bound metal-dependent hydrolase YbcI (DUF457 family)
MPLPIIHSYAGYQVYKNCLEKGEERSWKLATVFMIMANLADLDYLPGMLIGSPEIFHRSITHSFAAALLWGLIMAGFLSWWKKLPFRKTFLVGLAAYFSHIVLDYLTGSLKVMFWPFAIQVHPLPITTLFQHQHMHCESLGQFCNLLMSTTLTIRLLAEAVVVYMLFILTRLIPGYRSLRPGISESPAFIGGLAIFIFVITALLMTQAAV